MRRTWHFKRPIVVHVLRPKYGGRRYISLLKTDNWPPSEVV